MIIEVFSHAVRGRPYIEELRQLTGRDTPQQVVRDALDISAYVGGKTAVEGERIFASIRMTCSDEWGRKTPDLTRERARAVEWERASLQRLKPVSRIRDLACEDFNFSAGIPSGVLGCLNSFFGTFDPARIVTHALGLHQRFAEAVIVQDKRILVGHYKPTAEPLPFSVYENARRLAGGPRNEARTYSAN